jgi:hypothetical protein
VTGQLLGSQEGLVSLELVVPRLPRIGKNPQIVIAVSRSLGRYLNPRPSAYKAESYPLDRCSGCFVRVCSAQTDWFSFIKNRKQWKFTVRNFCAGFEPQFKFRQVFKSRCLFVCEFEVCLTILSVTLNRLI